MAGNPIPGTDHGAARGALPVRYGQEGQASAAQNQLRPRGPEGSSQAPARPSASCVPCLHLPPRNKQPNQEMGLRFGGLGFSLRGSEPAQDWTIGSGVAPVCGAGSRPVLASFFKSSQEGQNQKTPPLSSLGSSCSRGPGWTGHTRGPGAPGGAELSPGAGPGPPRPPSALLESLTRYFLLPQSGVQDGVPFRSPPGGVGEKQVGSWENSHRGDTSPEVAPFPQCHRELPLVLMFLNKTRFITIPNTDFKKGPSAREPLTSGLTDGFVRMLQFYIHRMKPAATGHLMKILSPRSAERGQGEKGLASPISGESSKCRNEITCGRPPQGRGGSQAGITVAFTLGTPGATSGAP